MKRLLCLILISVLLCMGCLAEGMDMPAWEYPLEPEILENKSGYITLVDREHLLGSDYEPSDLVTINIRCVSSIKGDMLRKAALKAAQRMFDAAEADGMILYLKSVYRAYSTQKYMYNNRLNNVGRDDGVVAYPGSSDHQTGLGADILNLEWTKKSGMTPAFAQTAEAQWMDQHCAEYGFIIRYMEDKEAITGIIYEPWHLRYVGEEAARYIMDNHLSLEEFDEEWHAYIEDWESRGGDFKELLRIRAIPNPAEVLYTTEEGEEEISLFP
ncbi:MAG: M15 family metallopeptidase [Clostridia bacterium]|nr:M15 family metallopeptidase [Clostridia bacterium]